MPVVNNPLNLGFCFDRLNLLFIESNPIPVKWMLFKMNLIKNSIRLPLEELDKIYQEDITNEMLKLKLNLYQLSPKEDYQ